MIKMGTKVVVIVGNPQEKQKVIEYLFKHGHSEDDIEVLESEEYQLKGIIAETSIYDKFEELFNNETEYIKLCKIEDTDFLKEKTNYFNKQKELRF